MRISELTDQSQLILEGAQKTQRQVVDSLHDDTT